MKRCPTCNRTYSDNTFTFCLEDGSLLSAPYDPDATLIIPSKVKPEPHTLKAGLDLESSDEGLDTEVPCPRGLQCSGSTAVVIQECQLVKTTKYLPGFISNKSKSGPLSTLGALFANSVMDATLKTIYEIYQCPKCRACVAFMEYEGKNGKVRKRLGDDL